MSIETQLEDLQTNLDNAKSAITTKGGTAGDTGLAGLATEIASIPSGGGSVTKPTTWAGLKAMTTTELRSVFPEGSIIDSISCSYTSTNDGTQYDNFLWRVVSYEPCEIENDSTKYPCVTLLSAGDLPSTEGLQYFDTGEKAQCDSATETVAEDGVYYYGTTSASGNLTTSNTTALNLAIGAAIPYSDYARIFKHAITSDVSTFVSLWLYGYNNYEASNLRQWLISNATTFGEQWTPTHVGDALSTYDYNRKGFLTALPSEFINIVSPTKICCIGNSVTDGDATFTMYDTFFVPSFTEMGGADPDYAQVEGAQFAGIKTLNDRCRAKSNYALPITNSGCEKWYLRTAYPGDASKVEKCFSTGSIAAENGSTSSGISVACRVLLAG